MRSILFCLLGIFTFAASSWGAGEPIRKAENLQLKAATEKMVKLRWWPHGYRIHYGKASGRYDKQFDAGMASEAEIPLSPGEWFFVLRAYIITANGQMLESDPTNEISTTILEPTPTPTPWPTPTPSPTPTAKPTITPTATPQPSPAMVASHLLNIATRANVGTGDKILIAGFIVGSKATGKASPVKVIVRAIGPSLTAFGVKEALEDPMLEIHDANGMIAQNDDWTSKRSEVEATKKAPTNDKESAVVLTVAPGAYTAIIRGKQDSTGVALVEVYDLQ